MKGKDCPEALIEKSKRLRGYEKTKQKGSKQMTEVQQETSNETANENGENNVTVPDVAPQVVIKFDDPVQDSLYQRVVAINAQIDPYNEAVNAKPTGTPVTEIDKQVKAKVADEKSELPASIKKLYKSMTDKLAAFKEAQTTLRNTYRTEVLKEEPQQEVDLSEYDVDALTELSKAAMKIVEVLQTFTKGDPAASAMVEAIKISRPGKKESVTVNSGGIRRPRATVTYHGETDKVYDSFGAAAKDLSLDREKLIDAWVAGGEGNITFAVDDKKFSVVEKEGKK